jgi:hypothetical protein
MWCCICSRCRELGYGRPTMSRPKMIIVWLKGLPYEIDFENVDEN